jgi:hypothetical protein
MCSLRFENNLLTIEGVRFGSISKKTPFSKLSFAFVSLALPLLVWGYGPQTDKHLPQNPFTGQFFRWRHFAMPSTRLIFLRSGLGIATGKVINEHTQRFPEDQLLGRGGGGMDDAITRIWPRVGHSIYIRQICKLHAGLFSQSLQLDHIRRYKCTIFIVHTYECIYCTRINDGQKLYDNFYF